MESSMNLYLSSEAFWNAHLHKVAEHSATVRPVQHVDVVGATFKFVKINSKKNHDLQQFKHEATYTSQSRVFF